MKRLLAALLFGIFGLLFFSFVPPVYAFEISKDNIAVVPKGAVTNGSFLAGGKSVTIDGTVNGDLICAAQNVIVNGRVAGDVLCVGQTISIRGIIEGNIRSAAQTIEIFGPVRKNVSAVGQTVNIMPGAVISGEAFLIGQTVGVGGIIGGGLLATGQTVRVDSRVNGGVTVYAQTFEIGNNAAIIGNVTYTSQSEVMQAPGAKVSGSVQHVLPKKNANAAGTALPSFPRSRLVSRVFSWPVRAAMAVVFYLIIGGVFALLIPGKIAIVRDQMMKRPLFAGFVGFLSIIVTVIVMAFFAITIIGIPITMLLALGFFLALLFARVAVGAWAGQKILLSMGNKKPSMLGQVLLGVMIVELIFSVPIVGGLLSLLATFWSLGGVVFSFTKQKR